MPSLEAPSVLRPKPEARQADGLVGNRNAPLGEEVFDVAEAETESVVEPYGVADDFRRESVSVICGPLAGHRLTLPVRPSI